MPKALAAEGFSLAIEYYREEDGRWRAPQGVRMNSFLARIYAGCAPAGRSFLFDMPLILKKLSTRASWHPSYKNGSHRRADFAIVAT